MEVEVELEVKVEVEVEVEVGQEPGVYGACSDAEANICPRDETQQTDLAPHGHERRCLHNARHRNVRARACCRLLSCRRTGRHCRHACGHAYACAYLLEAGREGHLMTTHVSFGRKGRGEEGAYLARSNEHVAAEACDVM